MKHILDTLDLLASNNSTNEKKKILQETKHDDFALLFKYAYDPFITFGISKIDISDIEFKNEYYPWPFLFSVLDDLKTRQLTGNAARDRIRDLLRYSDERFARMILNILKKDLRIGCGSRVINSVYENLLPEDFCMSANKYTKKKVSFPVYADTKLDGIRCIALINDDIQLFSRNGKEFKNYMTIEEELAQLTLAPGTRLDGEITMGHFQDLMRTVARKGEGIALTKDALYNIFDVQDEKLTFKERKEFLAKIQEEIIAKDLVHLKIVDGDIFHDEESLIEFYNLKLSEGQEGIMIKTLDGMYEHKRGWGWQKMKPELSEDLEIIRAEEGLGKYEGMLGKVICRLENGNEVHVGSGFKDDERENLWKNKDELIGRIIEIKFQERTKDGSLRFPIFMRFRADKE